VRDLILRDSFSERMNVEPHHDAVTCPGCLENILLVDARWPEGSDWQALLKVPQECALVCGGCHKLVQSRRRTARDRQVKGLGLTAAQAAVPPAKAKAPPAWGVLADKQTNRCVNRADSDSDSVWPANSHSGFSTQCRSSQRPSSLLSTGGNPFVSGHASLSSIR